MLVLNKGIMIRRRGISTQYGYGMYACYDTILDSRITELDDASRMEK